MKTPKSARITIPKPPIQPIKLLQKAELCIRLPGSEIILSPVVVVAETPSKYALIKLISSITTNGTETKKLNMTQKNKVVTTACLNPPVAFVSKFRSLPTNINSIDNAI